VKSTEYLLFLFRQNRKGINAIIHEDRPSVSPKTILAQYFRDETRIHRVVYQLAWTPARRKPVLTDGIAHDCEQLIQQKCEARGWNILSLDISPDHVHLIVQVWPINSAAEVVKECKNATSHELRQKYADLRKMPSLWTRAYYAATVGEPSTESVSHFVEIQNK
jgi:putative transposase